MYYTRLPGGGGHTAGLVFRCGNPDVAVADNMFDPLRVISSFDNKKKTYIKSHKISEFAFLKSNRFLKVFIICVFHKKIDNLPVVIRG